MQVNRLGLMGAIVVGVVTGLLGFVGARTATAQAAASAAGVEAVINTTCAGCHGEGATGGDRAPALVGNARLRAMTDGQIAAIIRGGTSGGMPPFHLPDTQITQLVDYIRAKNPSAVRAAPVEQITAGERFFFGDGGCAQCHMVRGRGGVSGPDLSNLAQRSTLQEIEAVLNDPTSQMGAKTTSWCPGWAFCPDLEWTVAAVKLRDGRTLRGFARNEGEHDIQLQGLDGKFRLLTEHDYVSIVHEPRSYMPPFRGTAEQRRDLLAYLSSLSGVPLGPLPPANRPTAGPPYSERWEDWPTYDGRPRGNRYSGLSQINVGNVARLQAQWVFAPGGAGLQNTPVVVDGVMYVTGAARVCALDARSGRRIWCAARISGQPIAAGATPPPRPSQSAAQAANGAPPPSGDLSQASGPNRGVAISGDHVFFVSDDAYLVCLNRLTGAVMWIQPLPDPAHRGRYYNSSAPLVVGDLVISGVAGGDSPLRGFLAAFKVSTGELAWRFWTIPGPGEPGSETWPDRALPTGGGATWTTGSYDPEAKLLYWAVGNPYPDTDSAERPGKNLYSNSVVALDVATGKPRWSFQFTPHDLHDWDANEPLVLADTQWRGRPRKLLLQANRNGFFYVLDRITGEFLLGKPFVKKLTWASGVGPDGAPILTDNNAPTKEGVVTCPSVRGATNWYASSFNPGTRLFYVMAAEDCSTYRIAALGFGPYHNPKDPGLRYLRALDIETGKLAWEKPLFGAQEANYSGVLSTAGGLVFHGETGGRFAAVDARTGKTLWTFPTNEFPRAGAMTYMVGGKQYVAVASGGDIVAFALMDPSPPKAGKPPRRKP
jgi:PQQ-dependent dehydrogenase (methanol/ethanol family)